MKQFLNLIYKIADHRFELFSGESLILYSILKQLWYNICIVLPIILVREL